MKLVLASKSPRRRALLKAAGVSFICVSPRGVPEDARAGEAPGSLVRRLASAKALSVAAKRPGGWVLGCDTVVVLDGLVLGKPKDRAEAGRMIAALSGRSHVVVSAFACVDPRGRLRDVQTVMSRVTFGRVPKAEREAYLRTKEPYDKAGAYGIQGTAARWVTGLEGDYFNVMGLPVTRVWTALMRLGAMRG